MCTSAHGSSEEAIGDVLLRKSAVFVLSLHSYTVSLVVRTSSWFGLF